MGGLPSLEWRDGRSFSTRYGSDCPGGCHLSRKIDDLLSDAGFRIEGLKTGYIPGPRIMTFLYEGTARPR